MKLINEAKMTLTLSVRIIIRKKDKHRASMLNLIFISQLLLQNDKLQICKRDKKLNHHSDHYLIYTILDLEVKQVTLRKIKV